MSPLITVQKYSMLPLSSILVNTTLSTNSPFFLPGIKTVQTIPVRFCVTWEIIKNLLMQHIQLSHCCNFLKSAWVKSQYKVLLLLYL